MGAMTPASRGPGAAPEERELVLVGGGHAHVQLLRRWMMTPVPGVHLTLVVDEHEAVYSGMLPGLVAGDYAASELTIDLLPLARRAGARCIRAAVTGVDPVGRRLELAAIVRARTRDVPAQRRNCVIPFRFFVPYSLSERGLRGRAKKVEEMGCAK